MTYVALLRGINVGGKNKVEMARLREICESLELDDVSTYINSGNVIFNDDSRDPAELVAALERAIEEEFGLNIKVLLRDLDTIDRVEKAIPNHWVTDSTMRCDVLFLSEEVDSPTILEDLPVKEGIDNVAYAAGAVIWQVDIENINRSGRTRVIGGQLYKAATVRNANTVRKLASLMRDTAG